MMISRTLSTSVWVAASISSTSMSRPSAISTQASQTPQGSAVGPCSQLRPRARMRAVVVLPTPRGPANTKDWAMRRLAMALRSVCVTARWPITSSKRCGRHFLARTLYDTGGVGRKMSDVKGEGRSAFSPLEASRLGPHRDPEAPAAHFSDCLALLPSGPDAVRRLRLHRVRIAVRPGGHLAPPRPSRTGRTQAFSVLRSPLVR